VDNLKFEKPGNERSVWFIEVYPMRWATNKIWIELIEKAAILGQCVSVLALVKSSIYAVFLGFKYPLFNSKITIIIYNLVEITF